MTSAGDILEAARQQAGLTVDELWLRYYGFGGKGSAADMADMLAGVQHLSRIDYDVIAQAINESFVDRDMDHPVPYAEDLPADAEGIQS